MIPTNNHSEELSWGTANLIEGLIQRALIAEKGNFLRALESCLTEEDGQRLIQELLPLQPIMGLHEWPHGQGDDLGTAIRYMVDKDDFYEQRDNTSGNS